MESILQKGKAFKMKYQDKISTKSSLSPTTIGTETSVHFVLHSTSDNYDFNGLIQMHCFSGYYIGQPASQAILTCLRQRKWKNDSH